MAFAKTIYSVTPQWSAECQFHNIAGGNTPPVLVPHVPVTKIGFGYEFEGGQVQYTSFLYSEGDNFGVGVLASIGALPGVYGTASMGGTWVRGSSPPYSYTYTGSSTFSVAASGLAGPFDLYKSRDTEPMPEYEDGPSSPCHPLHFGMKYCWGTDGTYSVSVDASLCSDTTSHPRMVPSWAGGGGGSTDLFPLFLDLGMTRTPLGAISGLVARITNVRFAWGDSYSYADFTGFDTTSVGLHCIGNGCSLELYCVTWSQVPLYGVGFSLAIYPPVIIEYNLKAKSWDKDYSGAQFTIPSNNTSASTMNVDAPYAERVSYWQNSWDTASQRVWTFSPRLNTEWMASASELVDPADWACTIEEHGLAFATSGESYGLYDWSHFHPVRNMTCSVQWPWDSETMPSQWISVGGELGIDQVERVTKIDVGPHVSNAAIRRTLKDDYLSYRCTSDGAEEYGLPQAYQYLRHSQGNDICCWEDYKYLKLTYYSEANATLTLTVRNNAVSMSDTHETSWEDRKSAWLSSIVVTPEEHTFQVPIYVAGGVTYIGLEDMIDRKLQHVYELELSGFSNTSETSWWLFEIRDLELVPYNPTQGTETGKVDCKVVYTRPDPGGLPISYEAWTTTAEGSRAARPPDQFRALCGEEGFAFVEPSRGSGTGIIMDHLKEISSVYQQINRLEGFSIDDHGQWASTASEYMGAFVDSSASDMLGGSLYFSDIAECVDRQISSSVTTFPVRPRVGTLYAAAGFPLPCQVVKILQGNIHGIARSGWMRRASASVYLFQRDLEGSMSRVETCITDDWGRFHFLGKRGAQELFDAGVSAVDSASCVTTWYTDIVNELRHWEGVTVSSPQPFGIDGKPSDYMAVAYFSGDMLWLKTTYNGGEHWVEEPLIQVQGSDPSVVWSPCDGTMPWVFYVYNHNLYQLRRRASTSSLLLPSVDSAHVQPKNHGLHIITIFYVLDGTHYSVDACWTGEERGYEVNTHTNRVIGEAHTTVAAGAIMLPDGHQAVVYPVTNATAIQELRGKDWGLPVYIVPADAEFEHLRLRGLNYPMWNGAKIPCAAREKDGTISFAYFDIDKDTGQLTYREGTRHIVASSSFNAPPEVWVNLAGVITVCYLGLDGAIHYADSRDSGMTWTE